MALKIAENTLAAGRACYKDAHLLRVGLHLHETGSRYITDTLFRQLQQLIITVLCPHCCGHVLEGCVCTPLAAVYCCIMLCVAMSLHYGALMCCCPVAVAPNAAQCRDWRTPPHSAGLCSTVVLHTRHTHAHWHREGDCMDHTLHHNQCCPERGNVRN